MLCWFGGRYDCNRRQELDAERYDDDDVDIYMYPLESRSVAMEDTIDSSDGGLSVDIYIYSYAISLRYSRSIDIGGCR